MEWWRLVGIKTARRICRKSPWMIKEERAGFSGDDAGAVQRKWAAESRGVKIDDVVITDAETRGDAERLAGSNR